MVELWHISNINWLRELPEASVTALRTAATIARFEAREMIFEPSPLPRLVYILETGLVRTYRASTAGEEITFGYIHPGEVFGELAAFSDSPRESYAAAVESSSVIRIPREVFTEVIRTSPEIVFSVAAQIERRFKQIESRVEDLVFRSARSRLARIMLQLADEFGRDADGRLLIDVRLTHAELATLTGTSRPTVSIALGEFEDEEIVTKLDGRIVLLDRAELAREADRVG